MSVSSHLRIEADEYDSRIRTFIPGYEPMIAAAARCLAAVRPAAQAIVDLGTGTGALAAQCHQHAPAATIIGIDQDPTILDYARERFASLGLKAAFLTGSFLDVPIPKCDAVVAALSLHHVSGIERKQELYDEIGRALRPGGLLVSADCFPASDPLLAALEQQAWRAHLQLTYSAEETTAYFAAWAADDHYVPLQQEFELMRRAGFEPEVVWRLAPMGVIAARKS